MRHPTDPWHFGDRRRVVERSLPRSGRGRRGRRVAPNNPLDRRAVLIDGHYGRQPAVSPSAVLTSSTRRPQLFKSLASNC